MKNKTSSLAEILPIVMILAGISSRTAESREDFSKNSSWDGRESFLGRASDAGIDFAPAKAAASPTGSESAAASGEYRGSSFDEVRNVLMSRQLSQPDAEGAAELQSYANGKLPHYEVTVESFFNRSANLLERDAKRTTTDQRDYYDRIKKLLHPNGICFTGTWEITEVSPYSGYFSKGKKARLIARASVALSDAERGSDRGFGFAGKLFPAEGADEPVKTANFFLVDKLTGTKAAHYLDVAMTNEPDLGFTFSLRLLKTISDALTKADANPLFRPLHRIAELGLGPGESPKTPKWMMIKSAREIGRVEENDFRRELDIKNYSQGLVFNVFVSDSTRDRESEEGWRRIGRITLKESFVSYGCDRRLHFAHPKIR